MPRLSGNNWNTFHCYILISVLILIIYYLLCFTNWYFPHWVSTSVMISHTFAIHLSARAVRCSPGLWYRQLWREEWVWPCPRFALRLCSTQQQHNENRSHFWVRGWLTCIVMYCGTCAFWSMKRIVSQNSLLSFQSVSLAVVLWH